MLTHNVLVNEQEIDDVVIYLICSFNVLVIKKNIIYQMKSSIIF